MSLFVGDLGHKFSLTLTLLTLTFLSNVYCEKKTNLTERLEWFTANRMSKIVLNHDQYHTVSILYDSVCLFLYVVIMDSEIQIF